MKKKIIVFTGTILITAMLFSGCTSKIKSTVKNFESNTTGLERKVIVYSVTGVELASYEGKSVRIETENSDSNSVSVLVDDKKHKFVNATVIIEER